MQKGCYNKKAIAHSEETCKMACLNIQDTLDTIGSKWKLGIISALRNGKRKLNELFWVIQIIPHIHINKFQELEMDGLLTRKVLNTKPVTVKFELNAYSETLFEEVEVITNGGFRTGNGC